MTNLEMRRMAGAGDLAAVRYACGFTLRQVARAVDTDHATVWKWEQHRTAPSGAPGSRYMRIITAMRNHITAWPPC